MKKLLLAVSLLLTSFGLFAQSNKIQIVGKIVDSLQAPVEMATVILLNAKDSSMVNFSRSEENGTFEFKGIKRGNYFIKISFVGFVPAERKVIPEKEDKVDLGLIKLNPITKELMEVVIKANKAPLNVKGDTIVYNASAFKVGANATVEDLLKKLPGIDVAADGSIKAQGETVKKVTVDGKVFFGDDPKLATKNLPADAIDQIEVFDDKSEESKLTGIEDGKKEKTINLELKEDFKKGGFGKFMAGAGSQERFESKANYNKFSPEKQFSFIGQANNVNQQGFSFDDYQSFKGNQSFDFGAGDDFGFQSNSFTLGGDDFQFGWDRSKGFSNNYAGGLNYNYDKKKTKLSSSYFYSFNKNLNQITTTKSTFSDVSAFKTEEKNTTNQLTGVHRLNLKLEQKVDSLTTIITKLTGNYQNADNRFEGIETYFNNANLKATESNRNNNNLATAIAFNSSVSLRRKFKKKGRSLSLKGGYDINQNNGNGNQEAINQFFEAQTVNDFLRNFRQLTFQNSDKDQLSASIGYAEPISKKVVLQLFYNYGKTNDAVSRDILDKTETKGNVLNTNLSRYFLNEVQFHRGGFNLRYAYKGLNISTGLAGQDYTLDASNAIQKNTNKLNIVNRNFQNMLPKFSMDYELKNNKYVSVSYNANLRQPRIEELQPIVDLSNPFYVSEGNPTLRPELENRIGVNFNSFNMASNTALYFNINYALFKNQIVYNQLVSSDFVTRSKPENISGGKSLSGMVGYGFPVWKNKIKFDINSNLSQSNNITFINNQQNNTNSTNLSGNFGINFDPNEKLSFGISTNLGQTKTAYSISKTQNSTNLNNSINSNFRYNFLLDFTFSTNFDYQSYRNDRFNFSQKVPLWNAEVSKIFLKSKKAELKLSVIDALNRNLGISQNVNQNYIAQERVVSLGRFFMLGFTYSLKSIGKSKSDNNVIIIN